MCAQSQQQFALICQDTKRKKKEERKANLVWSNIYVLTYVYVYLLWLCRGMYGLNTYLQIRVNCKRSTGSYSHSHLHTHSHSHTHRVISSVSFCEYAVDGSKFRPHCNWLLVLCTQFWPHIVPWSLIPCVPKSSTWLELHTYIHIYH